MCDIVEITTLPVHRNVFYKVAGNGLIFYVKSEGRGGAAVGLSKTKLSNVCSYWVHIAINGHTFIKGGIGNEPSKYTPELLSDSEYTKFWLSWGNGTISLGKAGNPTPLTTSRYNNHIEKIRYITFSSCDNRVNWKVLLPPVLQGPCKRTLSMGKPQWVPANEQLPDGSLIGGYENEFLYIIRSPHRGSLTPGKFVPSLGVGYISWGGEAHEKNEFEVLCGIDYEWVQTADDKIPVTAVEAGFSEGNNSEILYVGRAKHKEYLIPGKVQPSHRVCYVAYGTREIGKTEYEILTCHSHNKYASNKLFLTLDPNDSDSDVLGEVFDDVL